jgi:hypothetical protein
MMVKLVYSPNSRLLYVAIGTHFLDPNGDDSRFQNQAKYVIARTLNWNEDLHPPDAQDTEDDDFLVFPGLKNAPHIFFSQTANIQQDQ